jgi:hypothetical protein
MHTGVGEPERERFIEAVEASDVGEDHDPGASAASVVAAKAAKRFPSVVSRTIRLPPAPPDAGGIGGRDVGP